MKLEAKSEKKVKNLGLSQIEKDDAAGLMLCWLNNLALYPELME